MLGYVYDDGVVGFYELNLWLKYWVVKLMTKSGSSNITEPRRSQQVINHKAKSNCKDS